MFSGLFKRTRKASAPQAADAGQQWIGRGNTLLGEGKVQEALDCYRNAIAADPANASAHVNAGFALQALERHGEATDSLRQAAALDPQNPDARYLLGVSLAAVADFAGAADSFQSAVRLNPGFAFAHVGLAKAQEQLGRPREAAQSYEHAIASDGDLAEEVGMDLARLLVDLQSWDAALSRLERVSPERPRWSALRAAALHGRGDSAQALQALDEALRSNPQDLSALHTRGNVRFALQRYGEAVADFEAVLAQQPDVPEVLSNCGVALQKMGERTRARALLERAVQLRPDYGNAHYNLGTCLLELGECRAALACAERGLALRPDDANLHWNKAVAHFLLGELGQAWPEHEWRSSAPVLGLRSTTAPGGKPKWTGREEIAGKTVLLTAEQGLGDTIQFVRYAPLLAQRGAKVLLRLPQVLEPLFHDMGPGCAISPDATAWPEHDFQCPLLSLPHAFATQLETVPANVPYLRSEPNRRELWQQRLGPKHSTRVGLVWSGNAAHKNDANRSIPLRAMLECLPAGLQLVSLQKELRAGDAQLLAQFGVLHVEDRIDTFADTAALVDLMDLVVSVDTSVAHLAGAMGKPLWLLLPWLPDWRWMWRREDSPWYPTARLFRQGEERNWNEVLVRVGAESAAFAAAPAGRFSTSSGTP
ncbi:tetratricopeptide repeat protein [Caenimonas terrae]|uniref:Tetratricopeptide repeat protein n=1 Tax=Caenimonas terrae TaxID=696074 RepID=A0ABW0ND37_9BURK